MANAVVVKERRCLTGEVLRVSEPMAIRSPGGRGTESKRLTILVYTMYLRIGSSIARLVYTMGATMDPQTGKREGGEDNLALQNTPRPLLSARC